MNLPARDQFIIWMTRHARPVDEVGKSRSIEADLARIANGILTGAQALARCPIGTLAELEADTFYRLIHQKAELLRMGVEARCQGTGWAVQLSACDGACYTVPA